MVTQKKLDAVKELSKLAEEYPIIGLVDLEGLPTPQLQQMREQLRGTVLIKITKKRIIQRVLKNVKKENIDKLNDHLKGIPGLLFTKESPFKLYKTLQKNKSNTFAKAGQVAPADVYVRAGPTNFAPGPIIGELGALGIKAGVEAGKIAIKEDKLVAKEGDVISAKLAPILMRLDIKPMEIGLNLVVAYENGTLYDKKILAVDEQEYINNITEIARSAINLSFNIGYYTKETIELFISQATQKAKNLALNSDILTKDTVSDVLGKAEMQAKAIEQKTQS